MTTNLGIIKLRTLTELTKINFGPLSNLSVREVIDMKYTQYLKWIYYNISHITFDESLLNELEIKERVNKPGCDITIYNQICKKNRRRKLRNLNN